MRFLAFQHNGTAALGYVIGDEVVNLTALGAPARLDDLLLAGPGALAEMSALAQRAAGRLPLVSIQHWLPPVRSPSKAIAVGLNYVDHAAEGNLKVPEFPVLFSRYPSSWVGHGQPIVRPRVSPALDYEGELVVVIGKAGRHVPRDQALAHVAGYSVFNEGSVRDWQVKTHQWTIGKNFDASGAFGPVFVTADELPPGASGLQLTTRLNGNLMQDANTRDMVFDVARLVSECSTAFSLTPGDLIIAGTPSGVGMARKPPVFMKPGDVCEVSIEGIGTLSNPIVAEA
jgi:2-keto-4-pentenoate hydratase/2-oxohepta-3-ene-1,7-dioic acid hydratase in catechol pathway